MNIKNQTPSQFRGIDARTLLTLYSTHAAEEEWFPFIDAIQTLSEYALVEQFLVRKDNNVNIKKNVSGRQEIIYDDFGNPKPEKNENVIKYCYDEEVFKIILDFFNKIRFNETPIIGYGKRVVLSFEDGPAYSSIESHKLNFNFYKGEPYYPDVIYIIDKIKDLIMHIGDLPGNPNYGRTNYNFGNTPGNFDTIHFCQRTNDFSINCEIDVTDIQDFCNQIREIYNTQVCVYPRPSASEEEKEVSEELIETNIEFNKCMQSKLRDFYTYSYLCLLSCKIEKYWIIFDRNTEGLEWKLFTKEHIERVEKILSLLKKIYDLDKLKPNLLLGKNNGNNTGLFEEVRLYNQEIIECLRNSRAHMNMNDETGKEGYIHFTNSLRNTSVDKRGKADVPNFEMIGRLEDFNGLFYNIETLIIDSEDIYEALKKKNLRTDEEDGILILSCLEQTRQLLVNFEKFIFLSISNIEDKDLLDRYHNAAEAAAKFLDEEIISSIIDDLFPKKQSKSR